MNQPNPSANPPSLREQNVDRTRLAILTSAQAMFGTRGYAESGVRDIAAQARVNPALISRYYGSKLDLFEAALAASLDVSMFTSLKRKGFGERAVEAFFGTSPDAASVVAMMVFAAGDTQAREVALRLLSRHVVAPLEAWFVGAERAERAAQLVAVVTGFYTYRLMLPLSPLQGEGSPAMRRWLARTLQEIVDE